MALNTLRPGRGLSHSPVVDILWGWKSKDGSLLWPRRCRALFFEHSERLPSEFPLSARGAWIVSKIHASDFDGEDASATWLGKGEHVRTNPLFWKTSSVNSDAGIRDGQWRFISPTRKNGAELALYDIVNDPSEKQNLVSKHPDIVKKLSAQIVIWGATLPREYVETEDQDD